MNNSLFSQFAPAVRAFSGDSTSPDLALKREGNLSCYYAPFDWVNPAARVVLVGITPGRTQAENALREAKAQLAGGTPSEQALMLAKRTGAFSGAMRSNLLAMLDRIGLARWLGLPNSDALFGQSQHLLHTTSALPFPVYVGGENYNGSPDIVSTPFLRELMIEHFVPVCHALTNAVFVPLGPVPTKAMEWLIRQGLVSSRQVLLGLPHPSGANAERIAYFLGNKARGTLSAKTNADKLDASLRALQASVAALPA